MNRSELVERLAAKAETSKAAAARMVDAIFDSTSGAIAEAVRAGQQVSISGFGKFRSKTRAARKGRNPRTGVEIDIPESAAVAFTPAKALKDSLQGKSSSGKRASGGGGATARGGAAKSAGGAKGGGSRSGAGDAGKKR